MILSRLQILTLLSRAQRAGHLSEDGPTSLFVAPEPGSFFQRHTQLSVCVKGDTVTVRASRLPFVKPMTFSMEEIKEAQP